jgi:hypothetical protein
MAKSLLLVCPSCERHVRAVDTACPFCKLELSAATRASLALRPPTVRLGRAALYALGMGTISLTGACGGTVIGAADSGSEEAGADGMMTLDAAEEPCNCGAAYGGSPVDAEMDQITVAPPYGIAPFDAEPPDSGLDAEPDSALEDASDGSPPDGSIFPPYGLPSP